MWDLKRYDHNREDPLFAKFYPLVTDLSALLVAYHTYRVNNGHPRTQVKTKEGTREFDPHKRTIQWVHLQPDLQQELIESARDSFSSSWEDIVTDKITRDTVVELYKKIISYSRQVTTNMTYDRYRSLTHNGSVAGIEIPAHFYAVFKGLQRNDKYTTYFLNKNVRERTLAATLAASRVGLRHFTGIEMRETIGIQFSDAKVDFSMIDLDSQCSLNMTQLKKYGFGTSRGCPAAFPPSQECLEFISETLGVTLRSSTPTGHLCEEMMDLHNDLIDPWYLTLSPSDKEQLSERDYDILEGKIFERESYSQGPMSVRK
jgi:hypothetical protein